VNKKYLAASEEETWNRTELSSVVSNSLQIGARANIIFLGPDPADSNRMLIRKIIQLDEGSYAYEETRVTRQEG